MLQHLVEETVADSYFELLVLQVGLLFSSLLCLLDECVYLVGAQCVCHLPKEVSINGFVLIEIR